MDENTIFDKVHDIDLKKTMENSYIDYAMSVIASRALPDVRDGLKPVQRRILYAGRREVTVLNHIEMIQRQPFFQLHRIEPAIAAREAVLHVAVRHAVNLGV